MSGRILIVDDIEMNVRLLEAKLQRDYFEVLCAASGEEAIAVARREKPDLILLDVMMPGMDGFEACRILKSQRETRHIPIVMVTTLHGREDRVRGLLAGADDFLSKPIDDLQLLARVKNLLRLKIVVDELMQREARGAELGVLGEDAAADPLEAHRIVAGHVLVIDDAGRQAERLKGALSLEHQVSLFGAMPDANIAPPDVAVVALRARGFDGFRMIARLRALEATRSLAILAVVDRHAPEDCVRALELGAHDVIERPVDEDELAARVRTLVKRRRFVDLLRARLDQSLELAVLDPLTGLYNRRFLNTQLGPLVQRAMCGGEPVALVMADLDHFKALNDRYGHDAGDAVLKQTAEVLTASCRPSDFACRVGGEEFIVIMPASSGEEACHAAERMRRLIAGTGFSTPSGVVSATASFGVAQSERGDDTAQALLKRADAALYAAKTAGRNRVIGRTRSAAA